MSDVEELCGVITSIEDGEFGFIDGNVFFTKEWPLNLSFTFFANKLEIYLSACMRLNFFNLTDYWYTAKSHFMLQITKF